MRQPEKERRSLLADRRGAVMVEFLGVFMPLFIFFLSLVQLIFVQTASIVVSHSAMIAARAAAVIVSDDPQYYGGVQPGSVAGKKTDDIRQAASTPLAALGPLGQGVTVELAGSYGRDELITVRVEYDYRCNVPGGALFVCGADGVKPIAAEASMPNQGAEFTYGP